MNAMNGRRVGVKVLAVLAMIASLPACESGGTLAGIRESDATPIASGSIIRQRSDPARGRHWVLTKDGLDVYDSVQRRKLAHLKVPGYHWLQEVFACAPDLALDPKGAIVITSNAMTTLWRVDPESLAITRHELVVEPETGKDFGFTSLTYSSSRGAYYGVASFDGTVWRIDPQLQGAREPAFNHSFAKACGQAG